MNRLEREVLEELEAHYEFNEDRAVAIVALVREAVEQEFADAIQEPVAEVDMLEEMVRKLSSNVGSITTTVSGTGATTTNATAYGTTTVGGSTHKIYAPVKSNVTFKRVSNFPPNPQPSYPTITTTMDGFRQHLNIKCDCGWGLVVSTSIRNYHEIINKDINEHGKFVHGIDY